MHCFSLTEQDHVAHLVLNRPEAMNTMNPAFWRELDAVLTRLHDEGQARALVISSTGKHFSAGMALETFGGDIAMDDATPEGRSAVFDLLTDMQATFTKLETLRIPVIAAIHGGCIGGAVDMVTACCIRYATADAFFCIQEINIGMVADVGTLQRLPKLVPLGIVKELAYTGRRLAAPRALACGLVNEVFDSQQALLQAALQCAREIAAKPPVAEPDHRTADPARRGPRPVGFLDPAGPGRAHPCRTGRPGPRPAAAAETIRPLVRPHARSDVLGTDEPLGSSGDRGARAAVGGRR